MHVLDLIMYFIILFIIYLICPNEFKEEMGIIAFVIITIVYTIIYVIMFVWIDYNWINIFNSIKNCKFEINW